ncbi:hypothetical protein [Rhizobium sp. GN54]|uniref:hypothetical protein n=1 Tax=Rhizobium sp. GN54 TaxID=2898150 RepID=UPI001E3ACAFE|nr:hypothetical protein [Rhizobium sp. GN54]MCD2183591.1 hypothetical protein [Rhizobium sp. GN54]
MTLIVLALIGWGLYTFFKFNTKRGAETVRAHVFLGRIEAGEHAETANNAARLDVLNAPTSLILEAKARIAEQFDGKQGPMIAKSYGLGMTPQISPWLRTLAGLATPGSLSHNEVVNGIDEKPEWVTGFISYYVASELTYSPHNSMPQTVRSLVTGRLGAQEQQSLLVSLGNYLEHREKRPRSQHDAAIVVSSAQALLKEEVTKTRTRTGIERYVHEVLKEEAGAEPTFEQVRTQADELISMASEGVSNGNKLRDMILKHNMDTLCLATNKKTARQLDEEFSLAFESPTSSSPDFAPFKQ